MVEHLDLGEFIDWVWALKAERDKLKAENSELFADATRYRSICENATDITFWAGGNPCAGKVEIDPDQYTVKCYGSAKSELDNLLDAELEKVNAPKTS